jgi:2-oxo-4-hydroxy-4-carboxy-5-ureidoimidazoline decarboxylase
MVYAIAQLNQMSQDDFVTALGTIFEATPNIARQAWLDRPFADVEALHQTMVNCVDAMSESEKLTLIQAHPDLGARVKMAEASVKEQAGAGLDRLSAEEFEQFQSLNWQYKEQFGIPFIVAVKNHTKASILVSFECRLKNSAEAETAQALSEIKKIARFRLLDLAG